MNRWISIVGWVVFCSVARAQLLESAWTYQGRLDASGATFNGSADMEFRLFGSANGDDAIGAPNVFLNQPITDGLFSVTLDFGTATLGSPTGFLEIRVRPSGTGAYTTLLPRQAVTGTPYSIQTRGLFVDANNRVGVGTTAPIYQSDVDSGTDPLTQRGHSDSTSGTWLRLSNGSTGGKPWTLVSAGQTNPVGAGSLYFNDGTKNVLSMTDTRLSVLEDTTSIVFPEASGVTMPMIYMFALDGNNAQRMVISESPAYGDIGLRYDDPTRTFDFVAFNGSVLSVDLGSRRVGILEGHPQDSLDIGWGAVRFPDDTRQTTAYAPLVGVASLEMFIISAESGQTANWVVSGAQPGMTVIVTPPFGLPGAAQIAWAVIETPNMVRFRVSNPSAAPVLVPAGNWRITVLP